MISKVSFQSSDGTFYKHKIYFPLHKLLALFIGEYNLIQYISKIDSDLILKTLKEEQKISDCVKYKVWQDQAMH